MSDNQNTAVSYRLKAIIISLKKNKKARPKHVELPQVSNIKRN